MNAKIVCTTILVEKSPQALPLGAACIASAIKNSFLTKDFCEVSLATFTPEIPFEQIFADLSSQFRTQKKDELCICAFSVFVWNRLVIEKLAAELKKINVICIAGGPEITAHPESFECFDYTVCGEGEKSVPVLINNIAKSFAEKNNLLFIEKKVPENYFTDNSLCEYQSPYLDGTINPDDFGGVLWELARGCPFKCSYCYESKGEKKVRMFSMERISKELDFFAKKKVPQVFVLDPTYNADKKRALDILNLIAKKTPDTFYYFEARAEFLDEKLARAFTIIPCAVQIGLQSSNEEVLKLVNRPFNKKLFVKNINLLNNTGVVFGFDLIYGLPGENLRGFKENIDFALSLYPNNLELFCLSVLPGTDLFDRADDLHLNYEKLPPYHVINSDLYSKDDMAYAKKLSTACNFFYNSGRAVPWFNSVCHCLKIRPSAFFGFFIESKYFPTVYSDSSKNDSAKIINSDYCLEEENHKKIENIQIAFISELFKKKKMEKCIKACKNIIMFNGAISRVQDTGKAEMVVLDYQPEYIDSEYSMDIQFFAANVKPKLCNVKIFKNGRNVDYKVIKS